MNSETNMQTSTPKEKKMQLYLRQKELLDTFLEKGAITKEQYEKSFGDLTEKMGMTDVIIPQTELPFRPENT